MARLLAHSRDKDSDKKVDTDVLHASNMHLALAKEMLLHDVQSIGGLATCTALISTTLCNFGRALLLDASGTKFGRYDDMWRRLHGLVSQSHMYMTYMYMTRKFNISYINCTCFPENMCFLHSDIYICI